MQKNILIISGIVFSTLVVSVLLFLVFTRQEYIVEFDVQGGTVTQSSISVEGEITSLPIPEKANHTFLGWYTSADVNATQVNVPTTIQADTTLYAKWEVDQYILSFDSQGGDTLDDLSVSYGELVNLPHPEKEGHTFVGWTRGTSAESELISNSYTMATDITLYAQWEPQTYLITFDSAGGTSVNSIEKVFNDPIDPVEPPIKEGFIFGGWDVDIPTSMPARNFTATAVWEELRYFITFDSAGGSVVEPLSGPLDQRITEPPAPTKEGHTFLGWDILIPERMPAENITATALWEINQYELTFESNGGSAINSLLLTFGAIIPELDIPVRENYIFSGWNGLISLQMPARDLELQASWDVITFVVTFDTQEGNVIENQIVEINETAFLPTPVKEGHTFLRWKTSLNSNAREFRASTPVVEDMTIYAEWSVNDYVISFDSDGGNLVQSIGGAYGEPVASPADPVKEGYTFKGWSEDVPPTIPARNVLLTAEWEINTYVLSFDSAGGTTVSAIIQPFDQSIDFPTSPTREGYTFSGWDQTVPFKMPAENISFTAQWIINTYELTFELTEIDESLTALSLNIGETIDEVFPGNYHMAILTSSGRVFTWGSNIYGQLGDGTTVNRAEPVDITAHFALNENETIQFLSLGEFHSAALSSEGRLFMWGRNNVGQLGDGTEIDHSTPKAIDSQFDLNDEEHIDFIALGDEHSAAITSDDRVFIWGSPFEARLGISNSIPNSPNLITNVFNLNFGETIVSLTLSTFSSALSSEGRVFTWGSNEFGQLGDGTRTNRLVSEITPQFSLNENESIVQLVHGENYAGALSSEGRIFTWGRNETGQLGNGDRIDQWTPVDITASFSLNAGEKLVTLSFGKDHASAVSSQGRIFTWGFNIYGQLADGSPSVGQLTSLYQLTPGVINDNLDLNEITIDTFFARRNYSGYLTSQGQVSTWGGNGSIVGDGKFLNRWTPTAIKFNQVDSIEKDFYQYQSTIDEYSPSREGYTFSGWFEDSSFTTSYDLTTMPSRNVTLYGYWTVNQYSLIANTYDVYNVDQFVLLDVNETITRMAVGIRHSSALSTHGRLYMWGENTQGQLGDGTLINRLSPTNITVQLNLNEDEIIIQQDLGFYSSIALTSDGRVFVWGSGPLSPTSIPVEMTNQFPLSSEDKIITIGAGVFSLYALTLEGRVFTWGGNSNGALGNGSTTGTYIPQDITENFNLTPDDTIAKIEFGYNHASALSASGRVFSWGRNYEGQLGTGVSSDDRFDAESIPIDITENFNLGVNETITDIFLGTGYQSAAISSLDRVFVWGANWDGQLGDGTTENRLSPTEITQNFSLNQGESVVSLNLGGDFSSALSSQNRVFTWGANEYGQLGDSTTTNQLSPIDITSQFQLEPNDAIVSVSHGFSRASALSRNGHVFTWGLNYDYVYDDPTTNQLSPLNLSFTPAITSETTLIKFNQGLNIPEPTRAGYTFSGWFLDGSLTNPFELENMPSEDVMLYAQWVPND